MSEGCVYLVGAGPGDPGLLTVKAVQVLARADVVVYDNLVADAILDRLPARAERIYAGKEAGSHTMNQAVINALLEERARSGQTVVRLKGGDPFVFGRGGEEAAHLTARGIRVEVVPGVTSAIGVPAYAGIPVTHRNVSASFAVVTGRAGPIGEAADVEWARIAGADTVVVLMGVANHDYLVQTLLACGRHPNTPTAAIRWGTTARQQTVVGTLGTIAARIHEAALRPPAVLVVGDVVSLIPKMAWAERRPLFGRRVLLAVDPPSTLAEPLERLGAEVLHVAPAERSEPASWDALDRALGALGSTAGVVFADEAGVEACFERLHHLERDARALAGCHIVSDGGSTARVLAERGVRADTIVERWDDLALDTRDRRWVVLGSPDVQRDVAACLGVSCETPPVCSLTTAKWRADRLRELLTSRPVHAIVFSNPAEVRRLLSALDPEERRALGRMPLVAARPSVGVVLRDAGLEPAVVVDGRSPDGVAEAVTAVLAARETGDA